GQIVAVGRCWAPPDARGRKTRTLSLARKCYTFTQILPHADAGSNSSRLNGLPARSTVVGRSPSAAVSPSAWKILHRTSRLSPAPAAVAVAASSRARTHCKSRVPKSKLHFSNREPTRQQVL